MALIYKNQARIEALSRKVGAAAAGLRRSDLEFIVFGGGRGADELKYYNNKNADAAGVNRKDTDAGITFWDANGAASNRADQAEHDFYKNGNFT